MTAAHEAWSGVLVAMAAVVALIILTAALGPALLQIATWIERRHHHPSAVDTLVDADEWLAASETPVFDQLAVEHLRAELDDQPAVDRWLR